MKKLKKILLLILLIMMMVVLTACGDEESNNNVTTENTTSSSTNSTSTSNLSDIDLFLENVASLTEEEVLANAEAQMADPEEGETIAIFHVENYGDITVKFFDDVAPLAVENFITHAEEGYYDGLTFHRVIEEFMIQGGDPNGNGTGGETIWGEDISEELSETVLPYRGALCMASGGSGTSTIGSQFFIVQANYSEVMESYLSSANYPNLLSSYQKYGGDLYDLIVYGQYTTFGQVIDGMDVVDEIASVETDSSNKPTEDVVISSIEITTYSE